MKNSVVKELFGISSEDIPKVVIQSGKPVVFRGLVKHWPLVQEADRSVLSAANYLKGFYNGRSTIVCKLPPENKGRLFYSDNCTRLNYESYKGAIDSTIDAILEETGKPDPFGYYIASNIISTHFPGFNECHPLTIPRDPSGEISQEVVSIWIGSNTTATCHFDALDNIACCAVGRRRFTLFPPDQVHNLYPGPLEPTPGGQVISLVDFENPDFQKYPNFKKALEAAEVIELEQGDALFLPSMWWHHVEGLEPFNILINYWWTDSPPYLATGMNAILMAMLGIRDKPEHEKKAWKHLFDYYIFGEISNSNDHIPKEARGFLDRLDEMNARKLRALLINRLNR